MRKKVSLVAGVATALLLATLVVSCDDSTGPNSRTYTATLIGANEVPPNTVTGTGVATFVDNTTQIDWSLSVTGLTAVSASHIHVGAATTAPPSNIVINLFTPNGATGTVNGVIATGIITAANNQSVSLDSLRTLFNNGNAYVNVHTTAIPGGAIRGQVARSN